MVKEKTITELYGFLQEIQRDMVRRNDLREMRGEMATMRKEMAKTEELHELYEFLQEHMVAREEFTKLEKKVDHVENQMVTKSYLDEKFFDLKGDLTVLMRKEDKKLSRLIEILKNKKVIGEGEAKELFNMEPFPGLAL